MVRFNLNKATLGTAVVLVLAAAIAGAIAQSGPGNYVGGYPGSKYAGQKDMLADMLFNGDTSVTGGAAVSGAKFVGDHNPNFISGFSINSIPFAAQIGGGIDYNAILSGTGLDYAFQSGGVGNPFNFYKNTFHRFTSIAGGATYADISAGGIGIYGSGSGFGTFAPQAAMGTPSWTLPTNSGTVVVSASSPGVINAATGNFTCPTCVTSSGGGAISGTAPIAVSAAGVVSINAPYGALTASLGGIVYSGSTNLAILAGTATARQMLQSGASAAPAWSTATWPATTTAKQILYSSATNVVGEITTGNSSILVTDSGGTPSLSTTIPNGVTATTQSAGDNSTKVATTAYVNTAVPNVGTAFTPTVTGLTVVNGTGGVTYTGEYTKIGNVIHWQITVAVTGTATTASTKGTTTFSMPTTPASSSIGFAQGVSGVADGQPSGAVGTAPAVFYAPTWVASNFNFVLSGWYFTS